MFICYILISIPISRNTESSTRLYSSSSNLKGQDLSSSSTRLSSYLPPDMHSQYMTPQLYSPVTLPRRLPSQVNSTRESEFASNKYTAMSPATHRKEMLGSVEPKIRKELICPPSKDRAQPSSLNYLKPSSKSKVDSKSSSVYPSALPSTRVSESSKSNKLIAPKIVISSSSSYNNRPICSSRISSEDLRYNSLPGRNAYRSSTSSGYSTPSSTYSSRTSNSYQSSERASSIQPGYKRISPHTYSTSYLTKIAPGTPTLEESKSRRRYITKSEAALDRPSTRPW